jgi:hypothetical protein
MSKLLLTSLAVIMITGAANAQQAMMYGRMVFGSLRRFRLS